MIASVLSWVAKVVSAAHAEWRMPVPNDGRQRIFFGNHTSHLDFMVVWSALPEEMREKTRPVAGSDYWMRGPIRRYLVAKVFKAILLNRKHRHATPEEIAQSAKDGIERMAREMGSDSSIIVFPEGTRGDGKVIAPFKSGLYYLCRLKPDIELVPVYLANMHRILPKGEVVPIPMESKVVFGEPMHFDPRETKEEFLTRARQALVALKESS